MVQMLIDAGADSDLEKQCNDKMTPINYAVEWRRQDIIDLLGQQPQ
jgi:hypothetical protein